MATAIAVYVVGGGRDTDPLERWAASQVTSIASYWLAPDLEIGRLSYRAPATIMARDVRLVATAPDGGRLDIVSVRHLEFQLAEIPKIGRPLVLESLVATDAEVWLVAEAEGSRKLIGFSNLLESADDEPPENVKLSRFLRVRRIDLADMTVIYDPRIDDTRPMRLDELQLSTDVAPTDDGWYGISMSVDRKPVFDLDLQGRANLDTAAVHVSALELGVDVEGEGVTTLPPQLQEVLNAFELIGHLTVTGAGRFDLRGGASGDFDLRAALSGGHARVGDTELDLDGLELRLQSDDWPATPTALTAQLAVCELSRPVGTYPLSQASAALTFSPGRVDVGRLQFAALGGRFDMHGGLATSDVGGMKLDVAAESIDLAELTRVLADQKSDALDVEGKLTGRLSFSGERGAAGGADVAPAPEGGPVGGFDTVVFASIDRLPPGVLQVEAKVEDVSLRWPQEGQANVDAATVRISSTDWPLLPMQTEMRLEPGNLSNGGYDVVFDEIDLAMTVAPDAITVDSSRARVFDGELTASGVLRREQARPSTLSLEARRIQLEDVVKATADAGGKPSNLAGRVSGEARLHVPVAAWSTQAAGEFQGEVTEGYLLELPLVSRLAAAMKGVTKLVRPTSTRARSKDTAKATCVFAGDRLHCGKIRVDTSLFAARGEGDVFFDGRLNMEFGAGPTKKVEPLLGPLGKIVGGIADQFSYYKVRGRIGEPTVKLRTLRGITGKPRSPRP